VSDNLDDLAAELRALAAHLEVGEPADQRSAVRARLAESAPAPARRWTGRLLGPPRNRRSAPGRLPGPAGSGRWTPGRLFGPAGVGRRAPGRRWVLGLVAVLIALVAGVAPARAAVVDAVGGLLRIAGIEVRQEPAPGGLPAKPSPLPSLRTAGLEEAQRVALFPLRVPAALGAPDQVQLGDPDPAGAPRVVSLLYHGGTVRLDEFDGGLDPVFFKTAPDARWTDVGAGQGIWLPAPHPVTYVGRDGTEHTRTARLAGPTLIWTAGTVSYRLEGIGDLEAALTIGRSLT
jgi:hypothetical protein